MDVALAKQVDRNHLVHIQVTSESHHLKLQLIVLWLRHHKVLVNVIANALGQFLAKMK